MEYYQESTITRLWNRLLVLLVLVAGIGIGISAGVYTMQKEAIKQGFAHYHAQSGNWQWGVASEIMLSSQIPADIDMQLPVKAKKYGK